VARGAHDASLVQGPCSTATTKSGTMVQIRPEPALLPCGRWRRERRVDTHIVLRCPPTMDVGTVRVTVRAPCTRHLAV
jgi:hypothetical protein